MKKITISLILVTLVFISLGKTAFATDAPSFPSCLNPQGTLKVKYDNGTHGIVGDTGTYNGRDEVYSVSDNTLVQCFCPDNGDAIQTNWWKTDDFSVDEIKKYQSLGWKFVPNGEQWGLSDSQYMAWNFTYSCHNSSNNSNNSNSSSNSNSNELGVSQVLALASTGNIVFIYGVAAFGLALIAAGAMIQQKNSKNS